MKIYTLERKQFLPISLDEAWAFFSSPKNLAKITPKHMGFDIQYISNNGSPTYPGQLIRYKISPLPGIKMTWLTEITHVQNPYYFVDEQRFGPYTLWHHQHRFTEVDGGVEMVDEVNYAIPLGFLGRIANAVFVKHELDRIFEYRYKALEKLFKTEKVTA